jgi:hypothetical protein
MPSPADRGKRAFPFFGLGFWIPTRLRLGPPPFKPNLIGKIAQLEHYAAKEWIKKAHFLRRTFAQ